MAKEFLMVGKNIPYEVRTEATRQLERLQEQGAQPIDGEYEKTEEILRFIGMINRCLGEEFRELGIDGYTSIEPGRFHIMSRKAYEALPESEGKIGFHSVTGWAAYLDGDVEKLVLYKTMIHEAVHVCSRSAYKIVGHESGYSMNEYRSGYRSMGFPDRRSGWHEHLRGVNEGVVDIFTLDIIFGHAEEFSGFFSEKDRETTLFVYSYVRLLESIMRKIAEYRQEDVLETRKRFKRGVMTGEMMHLRDVERVFGPGALRMLAAAYSGTRDLESSEVDEKLFRYFETDDKNEQDEIANDILNDRELEEYYRIRNAARFGGESGKESE